MKYEKVIIIGAPRSGTNMLRDVLCRIPGLGTWPCDEINYIWRHGNARWPSDEFPAELATPRVSAYLERQFARRARIDSLMHVVEKTCANSLRVPFLQRALPDARYIFIHRDPLDAVPSAMKRWRANLDLWYTLEKARFVPPTDLPYYALRFLANRFHRLRSKERRVASWGPRFNGMESLLDSYSLPEICAAQWNACVERAAEAFQAMPPKEIITIRYEEFVTTPEAELQRICDFLGAQVAASTIVECVDAVSDQSVGKGQRRLEPPVRDRIAELTRQAQTALTRLPP